MDKQKQCLDRRLSLASVDRTQGVINGVSVIAVGEARGHGMWIDAVTLQQVKAEADKFAQGVKVKINHGSGFDGIVGTLRNFRIEGEKLVADMWLLKAHDRYEQIMESAITMPDNFGLSIVFTGVNEDVGGRLMARCSELYSVDLVDEPAANPTGLFQETVDSTKETCMAKATTANGGKFTRDSLISEILGMLKAAIGMQPAVPEDDDDKAPEEEMPDEMKCKDKEPMEAKHQEEIKLRDAKILELSKQLDSAIAAIADLTKKLEEKRKLEDAEVEKAANLKAQETVRNLGVPNPKVGDVPIEKMSVLEQFNALKGLEKTMFFRKNRQQIYTELQK